MRKYLGFNILLIIVLLDFSTLSGHSERVHQYIAREAYKLLKLKIGADIYDMKLHLGTNETDGYVHWYGPRGSDDFLSGKIVCGAFREDVTGIVYGYGNQTNPTAYGWATLTHFWNADRGDDFPTNINKFISLFLR